MGPAKEESCQCTPQPSLKQQLVHRRCAEGMCCDLNLRSDKGALSQNKQQNNLNNKTIFGVLHVLMKSAKQASMPSIAPT
jgi:hypothetical protein